MRSSTITTAILALSSCGFASTSVEREPNTIKDSLSAGSDATSCSGYTAASKTSGEPQSTQEENRRLLATEKCPSLPLVQTIIIDREEWVLHDDVACLLEAQRLTLEEKKTSEQELGTWETIEATPAALVEDMLASTNQLEQCQKRVHLLQIQLILANLQYVALYGVLIAGGYCFYVRDRNQRTRWITTTHKSQWTRR